MCSLSVMLFVCETGEKRRDGPFDTLRRVKRTVPLTQGDGIFMCGLSVMLFVCETEGRDGGTVLLTR